jgi:hypothetical protein
VVEFARIHAGDEPVTALLDRRDGRPAAVLMVLAITADREEP